MSPAPDTVHTLEHGGEAPRAAGRPRIGLVLDHPRRDLHGLVLIALELAAAGATAVIIPQYGSWIDARLSKLDAIVYNYARSNNIEPIRVLARCGIDVFVLDTEGYLSSDKHAMLLEAVRRIDVAPWLQGYFVWGSAAGEALAKSDLRLAPKLEVTGCPRFDLLAPRWRGTLKYERSGYVLLNPNFNGVNPLQSSPAEERNSMIRSGWEPAYLDRFLEDMRAGFAGFLELCATLPRRLPHLSFVVRPHPFELAEPYRKAVAGLPNVRLNTEGEVLPVLANARRLVHFNCNTSVEARLLGLAPIQTGFLTTDFLRTHLPLYTGVSVLAHDIDDLGRLLEDDRVLAARDNSAGVLDRWIRPAFHHCDGHAAERVARGLIARTRPREERLAPPEPQEADRLLKARRTLKMALSRALGTSALGLFRAMAKPDRREKAFSLAEVESVVAKLSAHLNRPAPQVRRLRSTWTGMPLLAIQIA